MFYRLLPLLAAFALSGCASLTADYQERLKRSLPNQRDVSFGESKVFPGKTLCGSYTSLTGQGFSMRTSPYVVGPELLLNNPSDDERLVYCSKDPARALYLRLDIAAPDGDWEALAKVRNDMLAIDTGITRYYNYANTLPRDLAVLLEGDFGVVEANLTDPWGRAYHYEGGLSGRTTPQYQLVSLGADGAVGGRGDDADIAREQIQMLDHVLRLEGY